MATQSIPLDILFGAKGAGSVSSQSRVVANSLKGITGATRMLRAGLLGIGSMVMGAQASFVVLGLAVRRAVQAYSAYTDMQARLRTTLATSNRNIAVHQTLLRQHAESVGRDLGYSLVEASDAMNTLIEAGMNSHEAMNVYAHGMELARIGNMSTADSMRFMTDTMAIFQRERLRGGTGPGEGLIEFSGRMAAQLAVAAARSSTTIEELQASFRMAGSELATFGYDSRESIAALSALSTVGIRGSTAGYRLRSAMVALRNPARRTIQTFADIRGISFQQAELEFRNLTANADGSAATLTETMERLQAMFRQVGTEADRQRLASRIFGRSSLSSGAGLAGLTSVGDVTRRIYSEISDSSRVAATWEQMRQERMRSFSMQVQQARHAVEDFATAFGSILFSGLSTANEGFGDYLRHLSEGVMLIGELNGSNREARTRWRALSPEVRRNAVFIRQIMTDLTRLIRTLAEVIPPTVEWIRENRNLAIGLVVVSGAFGGVGGAITTLGPILVRGAAALSAYNATLGTGPGSFLGSTLRSQAATIALAAGILYAGNAAVQAISNVAKSMPGMREEYERLDSALGDGVMSGIENIPAIGDIVANLVRLVMLIPEAARALGMSVNTESLQRSRAARNSRSAGVIAEEQAAVFRRSGLATGDATVRGAEQARSQALMRWAALANVQGIRTRDQISQALRAVGYNSQQLEQATTLVRNEQMRINRSGEGGGWQFWRGTSAQEVAGDFVAEGQSFDSALTIASTQLREFANIINQANDQFGLGGEGQRSPVGSSLQHPVQDAYVSRGGLVNVSSDDLIVNRSRLAQVISAGRGELAGLATGGGGNGDMTITVPVVVDGREIARATGRAQSRQMERGGARLEPGQRRSLRETGSRRHVG